MYRPLDSSTIRSKGFPLKECAPANHCHFGGKNMICRRNFSTNFSENGVVAKQTLSKGNASSFIFFQSVKGFQSN